MYRHVKGLMLLIIMPVLILAANPVLAEEAIASSLRVPPGFRIETVANVPKARSMAWGSAGTLFVGSQLGGKVHAVTGLLSGSATVLTIAEKLQLPNGIAFADGDLYVAETHRILRYPAIESHLNNPGEPEVILDGLPAGKLHSWRYLAFGPDGKLYVTIGAPCNVCDEPDYGLILRLDRDGTNREVYARGIRNSVGLAWHPLTGALWFTDNNRDMMGDDEPPGELNRAARPGLHFGFPFCHGIDTVEPEAELAALGTCADAESPALELPAHVAALGLTFYRGDSFPDDYQNQLFIAEHGSWNRSEKTGYRVVLVRLDKAGQQAVSYEPFVDGWLKDGKASGRPVDVLVAPDGSLLISDDKQGRIYRVSYVGTAID